MFYVCLDHEHGRIASGPVLTLLRQFLEPRVTREIYWQALYKRMSKGDSQT